MQRRRNKLPVCGDIDDEHFGVINDMDEDENDNGFKKVTVPSPAQENYHVSEQLPTDSSVRQHEYSVQSKMEDSEDDHKEVTTHSAAHDQAN